MTGPGRVSSSGIDRRGTRRGAGSLFCKRVPQTHFFPQHHQHSRNPHGGCLSFLFFHLLGSALRRHRPGFVGRLRKQAGTSRGSRFVNTHLRSCSTTTSPTLLGLCTVYGIHTSSHISARQATRLQIQPPLYIKLPCSTRRLPLPGCGCRCRSLGTAWARNPISRFSRYTPPMCLSQATTPLIRYVATTTKKGQLCGAAPACFGSTLRLIITFFLIGSLHVHHQPPANCIVFPTPSN